MGAEPARAMSGSPVILIEFDHQRPVGTTPLHPATGPRGITSTPSLRTPNGNDYGRDLLRQHLVAEHGGKY
jgi:hypothetical protein